jgi:hypothetical protein
VRHSPEDSEQIISISEIKQDYLQKRIKKYIDKAKSKRNPDGIILGGSLFRREFQPVWKIAELGRSSTESEESIPGTNDYLLTDSNGNLYAETWNIKRGRRPKREIYDRQKHGDLDRWIDLDEFRSMELRIGILEVRKKRPRA